MLGVDPQKLAAIQASTRNIKGSIVVDYEAHSVLLELSTSDKEALKAMPGLLESFSRALAQQLETFFAISGEIVDRNKLK